MELALMRRRVSSARVGRFATVTPEGTPHIVPFVFVLEGDTLYSTVDEKPKSSPDLKRIRNLRSNPAVEVVVDHYEEPWETIWWVRLSGRGEVLTEGSERERAIALLREKYPEYLSMPAEGDVVAVRIDRWRGWSFRPLESAP